ncbi:S58 family peptidase [Paraflavitalea soli]|uniref:S58 family peptidase n=1 Tax=Paraflavitalea soli TaxID=2315862 RepID=A0A3B7MTJ6_9BACT|nr:P1 family peptidase [Paraflavitalea soli]AXY76589.1 S58 family peptidase [Paraflavitalea soli]
MRKILFLIISLLVCVVGFAQTKKRARDYGIPFAGTPGANNAITDVDSVTVGMVTLKSGEGKLEVGKGPIRTGVTAVLPWGKTFRPVFASQFSLNGNGEMTGYHWIKESGFLESPILITNTHSVGVVRDGVIGWQQRNKYYDAVWRDIWFSMPVVAETYDGMLNDINGFHVTKEHTWQALDGAKPGPVQEGAVGGGTGMIALGFKGGTGTSSRVLPKQQGGYTVGVLVQANFGGRRQLTIGGYNIGRDLLDTLDMKIAGAEIPGRKEDLGSIIVVLATNAPLLPHQVNRLLQRVPIGIGKTGGIGGNSSGDIFIGFSTANPQAFNRKEKVEVTMLSNDQIDPLFEAVIQATEEAIINALFAAETTTGINNNLVPALPKEKVVRILKQKGIIK